MSRKYIIYKHVNKINGKIYIGCTCRTINARAGKNGKNYSLNKRFWSDIQKFGWNNFEHYILYDNIDTLEKATKLETEAMNIFESYNPEKGYNIHSTSNAKSACSSNLKMKVYQYDLKGNYLNEYDSMNQAAIYAKCDSSQISRSCKKHKHQAGGYLWRTEKTDVLSDNIYVKRFDKENSIKKHLIFCFDKDLKFINKIYKSYEELKENKLDIHEIKGSIKSKDIKLYNDIKWSRSICPFRICKKHK